MANYLHTAQSKYNKARKALEKSLDMLEAPEIATGVQALQSLNVTDDLAQVFREKPVILIQSMNVQVLVQSQIYTALRALDDMNLKLYRDAMLQVVREKLNG